MIKRNKSKENGGWIADIQPGGRGAKRFRKTFATKREALEWETWVNGQVQQEPEWSPKPTREVRRLTDLIEIWWQSHGRELRAGRNTRQRLDNLAHALGNPFADKLTATDFTAYRGRRLDAGISANAINREHAYLRSVFNRLEELGEWSGGNPLGKVRSFKIQENELSFLTLDQCASLLEELTNGRNPDVVDVAKVCLATGARWNEAEGLRTSQIRPDAIEFARTKTGKARSVKIDDALSEMLIARTGRSNDRLFASCYSAFRDGIERAGIELPKGQLTHVLRHTFASHFIMNGGNILALQRTLGHTELKTTMRYAHLSPEHMNEVRTLNPLSQLTLR